MLDHNPLPPPPPGFARFVVLDAYTGADASTHRRAMLYQVRAPDGRTGVLVPHGGVYRFHDQLELFGPPEPAPFALTMQEARPQARRQAKPVQGSLFANPESLASLRAAGRVFYVGPVPRQNPELLTGAVRQGKAGPYVRSWDTRGGKRRVVDVPVPAGAPDWRVELAHAEGTPRAKTPKAKAAPKAKPDRVRQAIARAQKAAKAAPPPEPMPEPVSEPVVVAKDAWGRVSDVSKPWTMGPSAYLARTGVHEPWIAEISPMQMGRMSDRQRAQYQAKRSQEWQAAADAKAEWRNLVFEAYQAGKFDLNDADVHPDAKSSVLSSKLQAKEDAFAAAFDAAQRANRVTSAEGIKVGDTLFSVMFREYVPVLKVHDKSLIVWFDGRPLKVAVGSMTFRSYDDLKAEVTAKLAGEPSPFPSWQIDARTVDPATGEAFTYGRGLGSEPLELQRLRSTHNAEMTSLRGGKWKAGDEGKKAALIRDIRSVEAKIAKFVADYNAKHNDKLKVRNPSAEQHKIVASQYARNAYRSASLAAQSESAADAMDLGRPGAGAATRKRARGEHLKAHRQAAIARVEYDHAGDVAAADGIDKVQQEAARGVMRNPPRSRQELDAQAAARRGKKQLQQSQVEWRQERAAAWASRPYGASDKLTDPWVVAAHAADAKLAAAHQATGSPLGKILDRLQPDKVSFAWGTSSIYLTVGNKFLRLADHNCLGGRRIGAYCSGDFPPPHKWTEATFQRAEKEIAKRENPEVLTGAVREAPDGGLYIRTWEGHATGKRRAVKVPVPAGVASLPDWRVDLAHGSRKLSRPVPELRGAGCRDTPLTYCGADGTVRGSAAMAGGRSIEYVWRVLPLDDLVTSHDPWTLAVAKEFPAELQPRDRSRSSYQDQIRRLVANFDPSLLFWSPNVSDGAPIIGPDNVVESGNGRTMALKRIFRAESDARDAYVDLAKRWARELGVKWPAKVDDPVLVRERLTKLDRAEFARLANVAGQQKMAAAEQALADAGQLDEDTLALYRPDAELETGANAGFVEAFIQRVAGPEARGDITDARGKLSAPGKDRILYALFAKAYGVEAESLLEMLAEQTDPEIRSVLRGMEQAAPMWASFTAAIGRGVYDRQYDLTRDLVQMARRLVDAKSRGLTVRALRSQADFVEGLSPAADLLLAVAHPAGGRPNAANLSATLADFVARVERQGPLSQGGMFDLPPVAAQKLLELAARHVVLDELDPHSARGRELGEWLARKNPAAESKLSPRQRQRYLGKLTGAKRAARAAEIVHRRAHRSTAPFATDVGQPTRRSAHARRFEAQFGRPPVDVADAAKLTGLPVSILRQVYGRGMAAWQTGHRPGAGAHAWAMARVQSFATGGPTATGPDADLARKSLATARKRGQAGALTR